MREFLWHREPDLRARAARTAADLEDLDALERMIELLDDPDRGVRKNTHRALQQLTRLGFPSSSQRWRLWLQEELVWRQEAAPGALDRIRAGDPNEVATAVQELSRHTLSAYDAVEELAELLRDDDFIVRRLACAGMEQLGSRAAIPALLAALDDEDSGVVEAAGQALQTLTGKNLKPGDRRLVRRVPGASVPSLR